VRAAELIGEDADDVTGNAAELTDSVGRGWLLGFLPAGDHRVQATHAEAGSGADFRFQRLREDWDPETELADFADDDPPL